MTDRRNDPEFYTKLGKFIIICVLSASIGIMLFLSTMSIGSPTSGLQDVIGLTGVLLFLGAPIIAAQLTYWNKRQLKTQAVPARENLPGGRSKRSIWIVAWVIGVIVAIISVNTIAASIVEQISQY